MALIWSLIKQTDCRIGGKEIDQFGKPTCASNSVESGRKLLWSVLSHQQVVRKRCSLELTFKCFHANVAFTTILATILDKSQVHTLPFADSWANKLDLNGFRWLSPLDRVISYKLTRSLGQSPYPSFWWGSAFASSRREHISAWGIHNTSWQMKQQRKETNDPMLHLMMNCSIVKGCGSWCIAQTNMCLTLKSSHWGIQSHSSFERMRQPGRASKLGSPTFATNSCLAVRAQPFIAQHLGYQVTQMNATAPSVQLLWPLWPLL